MAKIREFQKIFQSGLSNLGPQMISFTWIAIFLFSSMKTILPRLSLKVITESPLESLFLRKKL